ncbi:MAG: GTP cyclohydrolase I FolE [Planctomycetes bacterium]|nr:GTP cyclohydrolase I FolE [Planctomycetota bacterium]
MIAIDTQDSSEPDQAVCVCTGDGVGIDEARIERAVREILLAVGEDPFRQGLVGTPQRVARAYTELLGGLHESPEEHLARTFDEVHDELVLVRDIDFHSLCEHHLLPFGGRVHIAYLPNGGGVVGLSKLARTVHVFARRPQIQERMTQQIADALVEHLRPRGVVVMVEARHTCMQMRGVRSDGSMVTVTTRGLYRDDLHAREGVLSLMRDR